MYYHTLVKRVAALTAMADTPTSPPRDGEYKRIHGIIEGYFECGAITQGQMMAILRDLADNWYAYDESDIEERRKAVEEADKDAFLSGE